MQATYVSASSFTVSGNQTEDFTAGRRIKADCEGDGIKYATISGSSYSSPNTTINIDESTLTSNLTDVWYGVVQPGATGSLPDHTHDGSEGSGGPLTISGSGTTDHSALINLDYASSGHTGFASSNDLITTFSGLSDTPSNYPATSSGSLGQFVTTNSGTDGVTFQEFFYYGTSDPTISGVAEGSIYFKYTA
jgi:hypothetical protein